MMGKDVFNGLSRGVFCAVGVMALFTTHVSGTSAQGLKIASEGYYAPFNFINGNGELAGFDIDIANALCDAMGESCELVQNDWDRLIPGLVDKQYDAIVASMSITPEREAVVAFTLPYYSNMLTFVGKSGADTDVSPSGVKGKTVGVLRSTVSSDYLEAEFGDVVDITLYDTQEDALSGLLYDRMTRSC